jgi:hypothetical protein
MGLTFYALLLSNPFKERSNNAHFILKDIVLSDTNLKIYLVN